MIWRCAGRHFIITEAGMQKGYHRESTRRHTSHRYEIGTDPYDEDVTEYRERGHRKSPRSASAPKADEGPYSREGRDTGPKRVKAVGKETQTDQGWRAVHRSLDPRVAGEGYYTLHAEWKLLTADAVVRDRTYDGS
jgi:hypothetical protein